MVWCLKMVLLLTLVWRSHLLFILPIFVNGQDGNGTTLSPTYGWLASKPNQLQCSSIHLVLQLQFNILWVAYLGYLYVALVINWYTCLREDSCWGCVVCLVAGGFATAMFETCISHFIFTQRCFVTDCRWLHDVLSIYWPLYVSGSSWTWSELVID